MFCGRPDGDATGDELHERRVVQDEPLTRLLGLVLLVVAPELGDQRVGFGLLGLRGGVDRRQARGCVAS